VSGAGLAVLLGLAASVWPARAGASPLYNNEFGGTTFTGPTSAHVTSIYWNPAALVQLTGFTIYMTATHRFDLDRFERAPINSSTGEPGSGADRSFAPVSTTSGTTAWFTGLVWDLDLPNFRLGFAVYTPIAERQSHDNPQLGYHALDASLYMYNVTVALTWRVNSKFSVGVGMTAAVPNTEMSFMRDRGLEDCPVAGCAIEDPRYAELYHFSNDDDLFNLNNLSIHLGAMLRVPEVEDLTVGVGYVGPVAFVNQSAIRETGHVTVTGFTGTDDEAYVLRGTSRIDYTLPQTLAVGARYSVTPDLDAVLDFSWRDFSRHHNYDLRLIGDRFRAHQVPEQIVRYRGFKDVVALSAAVELDATSQLRVAARIGIENSAVHLADVTPFQLDAPKGSASLGAQLTLSTTLKVTAGYTFGRLLDRDVTHSHFSPSAYTDCVDSGYDFDACAAAREGRALPTAQGRYSRTSHSLSLGLLVAWW